MNSFFLLVFSVLTLNSACTNVSENTSNSLTTESSVMERPGTAEQEQGKLPDHAAFDVMLKKYVSEKGVVDYAAWKKNEAELDKYLSELANKIPTAATDKNEALAYWINAYNAYTIKLILKNYPVKSIQDINGGKPWDLKWIQLAGKTYTLNNIENDIIRPTFKDARIHFALVCAAKSCPPLVNTAFTQANLQSLLDKRTKNFINSPFNEISANKIIVSKLFDWYQVDFGNVITYLNKYADKKINTGASISYKDYDWSLNGK